MKVDKENIVHGFCYVFGIPIITYNHVFVLCLRKKKTNRNQTSALSVHPHFA